LPLEPNTGYRWQIEINGAAKNHVAFRTGAPL
jgi:predicted secreted protein